MSNETERFHLVVVNARTKRETRITLLPLTRREAEANQGKFTPRRDRTIELRPADASCPVAIARAPVAVVISPEPGDYIKSPDSGESYHRGELRHVASEWHGGQFTTLYAFSSSGTAMSGLAIEAASAADTCADMIEADKLRTIATLDPDNADDPYAQEAIDAGAYSVVTQKP